VTSHANPWRIPASWVKEKDGPEKYLIRPCPKFLARVVLFLKSEKVLNTSKILVTF